MKQHYPKLSQIPDYPCMILITGASRPEKTNAVLDLISYHRILIK